MLSQKAQEMEKFLKENYIPEVDYHNMDIAFLRKMYNKSITPVNETDIGIKVIPDTINGVSVEKIIIPDSGKKLIMHVHGGGMTMGNASSDRFMLSNIGKLTKRNTISVDYRLCPEYSQPAAVEDCFAVYQGLIKEGYAAKDIALLGESAGGYLILSLCAYLKKHDIEMPGCVCAISGSVDAEFNSPSMIRNRSTEMVVNLNLKDVLHALYYKDADPSDPVISPIYSDFTGWPPVYFHACKEEILLDESVRMYLKLGENNVETELSIVEGMFHCYMVYDLPESFEAYKQISTFINKH